MKRKILISLILPFLILSCKDSSSAPDELKGLIWSDEFEGNSVDLTKWKFETGANGWGNNEWQNYTENSAEVSDGTLKIIARKIGDGQEVGDYYSARMNSLESFTYGRMEIKAKIPDDNGNGLWPAIWMLGENISEVGWPACGEIDIMEYVSYQPNTFYSTIHSSANNHRDGTAIGSGDVSLPDIEEEFNIFGIIWTEDGISFYVEDQENVIFRFLKPQNANSNNWPFDKPHFFLLNMAVGGDWGGSRGVDDTIFPATFEIDYVRVFELDEE